MAIFVCNVYGIRGKLFHIRVVRTIRGQKLAQVLKGYD